GGWRERGRLLRRGRSRRARLQLHVRRTLAGGARAGRQGEPGRQGTRGRRERARLLSREAADRRYGCRGLARRADPAGLPGREGRQVAEHRELPLMVDPARAPGEHNVFVCGDDASAKSQVAALLQTFGWPPERILDLGGIRSARAVELYLQLWLTLYGT